MMKKDKCIKIMKSIMLICVSLICICAFSMKAEAKTVFKKGTIYSASYDSVEFTLKKDRVLYFTFDVMDEFKATDNNTGVEITLSGYKYDDYEEIILYEETFKLKIPKGSKSASYWYYPDEKLKAGNYSLEINSLDSYCDCKYTIAYYNSFANSFKIPSELSVKTGKTKSFSITNIKPENSLHGAEFKTSDKKIATVEYTGDNKVYVTAHKKGTCTITATLMNGKTYKCKVKVTNPSPYLKWKSYEVAKGSTFTNKLCYKKSKVKWTTTNKKVATVTSEGKVKGVGFGTCYIKATSNGKTYSCKVKVYRLTPNYTAYIEDYDTRNNRFQVRFYNHGKRDLIIYSDDAKAIDDDYKSYDRNLRLKKGTSSIVVKPGKRKLINFYVKGDITWYDEDDFTIRYYMKYHGKKYKATMRSDIEESDYYIKDKGWYYSYWNDIDPWEDYNF